MGQILELVEMECPICENVGSLGKRQRTSRALVKKGEVVFYKEQYFHCSGCGADFVPGKMMNENLARARNERMASKKE